MLDNINYLYLIDLHKSIVKKVFSLLMSHCVDDSDIKNVKDFF